MKIKLLIVALLAMNTLWANPPLEEGKVLFSARCASCHNVNKTLTGPALAGLDEKRSMDWIINFIRSSQAMIKAGDKDAIAVYEQFNKIPMPDHPDLTDDHIKSIVEFIKSESTNNAEVAPFARPSKLRPSYTPFNLNDYGFFAAFTGVVVLLIAGLVIAVRVKELQRSMSPEDIS
jgi:cytochrome c551/c552